MSYVACKMNVLSEQQMNDTTTEQNITLNDDLFFFISCGIILIYLIGLVCICIYYKQKQKNGSLSQAGLDGNDGGKSVSEQGQRKAENDDCVVATAGGPSEPPTKKKVEIARCHPDEHLRRPPQPLSNIGNTCYLNVILQSLNWTPCFRQLLAKEIIEKSLYNPNISSTLVLALTSLTFEEYEKERDADVRNLLEELANVNDQFRGFKQQDAFDVYNTIISAVKEEIENEHQKTLQPCDKIPGYHKHMFSELMTGISLSTYEYEKCHHVEKVRQSFTAIPIPVEEKKIDKLSDMTDIEVGLIELCKQENFGDQLPCKEEHNGTFSCYGNSCVRSVRFDYLPPVLVLQINRFERTIRGGVRKIDRKFTFPEVLNLSALGLCYTTTGKNLEYKIYAIICHNGSIDGGHYYVYIRTSNRQTSDKIKSQIEANKDQQSPKDEVENPETCNKPTCEDVWYCVSDLSVQTEGKNEALNTKNAFILFYELSPIIKLV